MTKTNLSYRLIKTITSIIISPFIKIDKNFNKHQYTGPKIYAANHPSTLDPIFIMSVIKEKVSILLTHAVFNIPIIGFLLRRAGHIPVYDNQGGLAYKQALNTLKNGRSILIFPEGHLSCFNTRTSPFSGAVRLSQETGAPIIPIGVSYSGKIFDKSIKIKSKTDRARFFVKGKYALTSGALHFFTGQINDYSQISTNKLLLMNLIYCLVKQSSNRLTGV